VNPYLLGLQLLKHYRMHYRIAKLQVQLYAEIA
jgi:hypothetical protein